MHDLQLYSTNTPNGIKITIALAELDAKYDYHPIDIGAGDQFAEDFLRISPNNKIPALVDLKGPKGPNGEDFSIFESGAILIYLAEKFSSPLLPQDPKLRYETLTWLMFQMGGVGPMLGQLNHFVHAAPEKVPYAIERYAKETLRICGVMDKRLQQVPYLAGDFYSIADIACFPWIADLQGQQSISDYPHLSKWLESILARPAVQQVLSKL